MITIKRISALLYTILSGVIVIFLITLVAGVPWGKYAMGGAFPGQFPLALRIIELIQAILIVGMAVIVLARAEFLAVLSRSSRWLIWIVVAYSALGFVLNLITPSEGERAIWAPITFILLISSAVVAFTNSPARPEQ